MRLLPLPRVRHHTRVQPAVFPLVLMPLALSLPPLPCSSPPHTHTQSLFLDPWAPPRSPPLNPAPAPLSAATGTGCPPSSLTPTHVSKSDSKATSSRKPSLIPRTRSACYLLPPHDVPALSAPLSSVITLRRRPLGVTSPLCVTSLFGVGSGWWFCSFSPLS